MKYSTLMLSLLLAAAAPAAAQERGASHRQFTFLDTDLTIEVLTDLPGTLQVVRGEPGVVDVAGKVPGGLSAAALGGREGDHLRLSAAGGSHADFIVVIPEDVYLRVNLPNQKSGELGGRPAATFTWDGTGTLTSNPAPLMMEPAEPVVAYSTAEAPRMLLIPRLTTVRTISVRLGSSSFEVAGNHYMSVRGGRSDNVEIRTGNDPEELVISVPAGTRDFTLQLAGQRALVLRGPEVTAYCEPVTEQVMEAGVRWFTFAPEAGRLRCH